MAETLAAKSPGGLQSTKKAMQLGARLDVASALVAERPLALAHMASADVQTGLAAFRARQTPEFPDPTPTDRGSDVD